MVRHRQVNKRPENYLGCMTGETPAQWLKWLPLFEWWYNANDHTITKSILYQVLHSETPPIHIPYFPKDSIIEAIDDFLTKREDMVKLIMSNLKLAHNTLSQLANKKGSERELIIWDWIYLKLQPYKEESTNKQQIKRAFAIGDWSTLNHNLIDKNQWLR